MSPSLKWLVRAVLSTAGALALPLGCSDSSPVTKPAAPILRITPATGVVVVIAARTVQLKAELMNVESGTSTDVVPGWTSSSPQVATVDAAGVVTGKSVGTVVITATSRTSPQLSASVTVSVVTAAVAISNGGTPTAGAGGAGVRLSAVIFGTVPPTPGEQPIVWTSLTPGLAIVDMYGVVYGQFPGQAVIVASARSAPEVSSSFTISVLPLPDLRPQVHVALGESTVDTIYETYSKRAIVLDLAASDVVDMKIGGAAIALLSILDFYLDPPDAPYDYFRPTLYLGRRAPGTGSFHLGARGRPARTTQYGPQVFDGPYFFKVRRAGPVLLLPGEGGLTDVLDLREGEVRTDSIWVKNVGKTGEVTVTVTVDKPGVEVLTPTLSIPTSASTAESHPFRFPPAATAIVMRFDGRQLRGVTYLKIRVTAPDAWSATRADREGFEELTVAVRVNP